MRFLHDLLYSFQRHSAIIVLFAVLDLSAQNREFVNFTFVKEPKDTTATGNQRIVLDCAIQGNFSRATFRWRKNDSILDVDRSGGRVSLASNGSLIISSIVDSSTSVTLQKDLSFQSETDHGVYQCVVTVNDNWTFVSRKARISVLSLSQFEDEPEDKTVLEGEIVQFMCSSSVKLAPNVTWYKDNAPIDTVVNKRLVVMPVSNSLQIKQVQISDQGLYRCKLDPTSPIASREGRLKVLKNDVALDSSEPKFVVLPKGKLVGVNDDLLLECAANGHPEPQIAWLKDRKLIELDQRIRTFGQGTLVISQVRSTDAGLYTCRASNSEDSIDASATVIVTVPPYFVTKPRNLFAKETQDVEFECKVDGKPIPTITWLKNGEVIVPSDYFVVDQSKLKIYGLVKLDQAVYQCLTENEAGNYQASAQLYVEAIDLASLQTETQLPSQPLNFKLMKVDGRTATLTWEPPNLNRNGLLGYVVYYKKEGSNRERLSNATVFDNKSFTVSSLTPNVQYLFRVVAFNKNGLGPTSAVLKGNTADFDGLPMTVRNLAATVLSPNSVEIRWDPPIDRDSISFYKLLYISANAKRDESQNSDLSSNKQPTVRGSNNDDDDYTDFDDNEETEIQVHGLSYTLHGLQADTPYEFRVEAVNKKGIGSTSDVVKVKTVSDVPSAPPRNVSVSPLTQDSVVMNWSPPAEKYKNGQILVYRIRYRQKVRGSQVKYLNASADENQKLIAGLQSGLTYNFAIAAATINGTGPYSDWTTFLLRFNDKGDDVVLGPVTALRLEGRGTEIHLFWSPPVTDGNIRGYKVSWGPGVPDVFHELVGPSDRFHIIKSLQPNREYVVCIRAFNKADGFPVYETVRTVAPSQPQSSSFPGRELKPPIEVRAVTRSASSIVLTWLDHDLLTLQSSGQGSSRVDNRFYNVSYSSPATHGSRARYIRSQRTSHAFEHLRPNTRYEFAVQVVLNGLRSEWSMTAGNHTFSSAPTSSPMDLTIVQLPDNPNSVIINWMPPKHSNGVITKYLVYHTTDPTLPDVKWSIEGIRGDRMTTTIDNILPDAEYTFKIQAMNDKGYSPISLPRSFRTAASNAKHNKNWPRTYDLNRMRETLGSETFGSFRSLNEDNSDFVPQGMPSLSGHRGSPLNNVQSNSPNGSTAQPWQFTIILVGVGVFGAVLACASIAGVVCVYRRHKNRGRHSARSLGLGPDGTPMTVNGKDLKPPPDLWIHHDHNLEIIKNGGSKRNGSVLSGCKNGNQVPSSGAPSLRDLEQLSAARRTPSPAPSDNQPRYHSLAMMPPPACGTLPRNYRHNVLSTSASNNIDNAANAPLLPQSARCYPTQNNTPHVVYTGPKNNTTNPNSNDDSSASPLGSSNVILSNNNVTTSPTPNQQDTFTPKQAVNHRNSNPLKSFSVLTNPPPAPPMAKIHSIRTVNGSPGAGPLCNDNRSPAPKLGSASVALSKNKKQQHKPLLSTPSSNEIYSPSLPPSQTLYGSMKDFEGDELNPLERSCSTEELSVQMRNLDNLMKDLNEISANEFDP